MFVIFAFPEQQLRAGGWVGDNGARGRGAEAGGFGSRFGGWEGKVCGPGLRILSVESGDMSD